MHIQATKSANAGPGILPVESHAEALHQEGARRAFSLELATGQSRTFGKHRPNTSSNLPPATPNSFDDHKEEAYALTLALLQSVLMAAFVVFIPDHSSLRIASGIAHNLQSHTVSDSKIPGCGGTRPPPREEDVSRAAQTRIRKMLTGASTILEA